MKPLYHKLIIAIFISTCSISCNSQDEQVEERTSLPTVQELKLLIFNVWQEETEDIHNALVVPWYATKVLEEIGLIDSYRTAHPNPNSHPGITWDWRDKIDEHRIDYIFYKSPILHVIDSKIYKAFFNEKFILNNKSFIFPSDHGIVVTTFQINT
jgi:hypothetical protein